MQNNPFIVAEISSNHLGDYGNAVSLVEAAKNVGADAVKFQVYKPSDIAANVRIQSGPWEGMNYRALYKEGMTPENWLPDLFAFARSIGLVPFASPFSESAVEFLETLDCPIYKIASPEIIHSPLIAAAAQTGKPLIISTGMAELSEIYNADSVARAHGATDITFLHCISSYPANPEDFNLETMHTLKKHNFRVGLSDHSFSPIAAICAVALGATVIEKHLTLSRADGGSDAKFSLEPDEFRWLVDDCREAAKAMGTVQFGCRKSEESSFQYRRSLWLKKNVKEGQVITEEDIAILRPNYGANPACFGIFVGMKARRDMKAGEPLNQVDLQ